MARFDSLCRVVLGALLGLGLGACCGHDLFEERRVDRQEEAASTHVSVLAVAPFEDYVAALQPKFSLTAEQALDKVVPTTRDLEEKFLDALLLSLKAAPPTSSVTVTESKITKVSSDGSDTATGERNVEGQRGPGDLSKIPVTSDFAKDARASAGGPPAEQSVLKTPVTIEPMLRYAAANALFQEVQILNRCIKQAPTRGRDRSAYVPYVVRLQVSVMPMARHMPYDVFANVAFFCTSEERPGVAVKDADSVPEVIPMLVTDNLEATMHSRSLDQVRQLSLAIVAMIQGVSASAEFQRKVESLQSVLGRDLNSLLTVGKLSQNMLRVRLGAAQEVEANHALVPQTHNVTVLLLVPPNRPTVRLRAQTMLRDSTSGKPLAGRTRGEVLKRQADIIEKYADLSDRENFVFSPSTADLEELMTAAVSGEADRFNKKLASLVKKKSVTSGSATLLKEQIDVLSSTLWWRDVLWEELVTFALGNTFSLATLDLPEPRVPELPKPGDRKPAVMDSGESARVTLRGGTGLHADELSSVLEWDGREFPARSVSVSDSGRDVTVEFPPLAKFMEKENTPVVVHLSGPTGAARAVGSVGFPALYFRLPEPKAPGFSVDVTSPKLDIVDTHGKILIAISFPEDRSKGADSATLSLRGATLDSAQALEGAVEVKLGKVVVKANARVQLQVSNVDDIVLVEASNSKDVKIPAIALQARRIEKDKPKEEKK